jgi:membrane protein implicated in regulation of membrane protease activity
MSESPDGRAAPGRPLHAPPRDRIEPSIPVDPDRPSTERTEHVPEEVERRGQKQAAGADANVPPTAPDVSVALPVIVSMTVTTAAFMTLITIVAIRSRRMRTAEGLIGAGLASNAVGEVRKPLTPIGSVYAGGEEWTARAADERPLSRGTPVRVVRQEGLTLVVEPAENSASGA